jgi:hypothetical protein
MDTSTHGFPTDILPFTEPSERIDASVSVTSVKFFEDNPNVLVAGIKAQGLRIHDLRGEHHHPTHASYTADTNDGIYSQQHRDDIPN